MISVSVNQSVRFSSCMLIWSLPFFIIVCDFVTSTLIALIRKPPIVEQLVGDRGCWFATETFIWKKCPHGFKLANVGWDWAKTQSVEVRTRALLGLLSFPSGAPGAPQQRQAGTKLIATTCSPSSASADSSRNQHLRPLTAARHCQIFSASQHFIILSPRSTYTRRAFTFLSLQGSSPWTFSSIFPWLYSRPLATDTLGYRLIICY